MLLVWLSHHDIGHRRTCKLGMVPVDGHRGAQVEALGDFGNRPSDLDSALCRERECGFGGKVERAVADSA